MLFVDIETAIEHIANDVELLQPLYEAIVNSIHSNSTRIDITIEESEKYIEKYSVTDNGDGYTPLNIQSFSSLWSKIKQEPGALGSGRLMYLRVFEYVTVESNTGTQEITFRFDRNFDPTLIKQIASLTPNQTVTKFHALLEEYTKGNPKAMRCDLDSIKENIFYELLPLFSKIWEEEKDITFTINGVIWIDKTNIGSMFQKMRLLHATFEIIPFNSMFPENFNLYYQINSDGKNNIHQFYGAAGRKVKNFTSKVKIRKLPNDASGIFCLTSTYLDVRVKDDRRDFKIAPNESNVNQANPISFGQINDILQIKLNEIILEFFPDYEKTFDENKDVLMRKNPHLSDFINQVNNLTYTDEEIVERAEKLMRDEYDKTRKALVKFKSEIMEKRSFDEDEFKKITKAFTKTGRDQLASYIAYRQTILEMLDTIINQTDVNKEQFKEKSIHELYMPQGTTSDEYAKYGTNMWIFDDKYMSYLYAASDKQIQTIKSKFFKEYEEAHGEIPYDVNDEDRPDMVVFFSDEHDDEKKDVLIVEFKKYNATYYEKVKAINQMEIYASVLYDTVLNIRSIFAYTILEIDEKYRTYLTRTAGFQENSLGDNMEISNYYKYNPHVKAHLHVMSFDQVIADAKKRNKVFLDILREAAES